jgi:hypothetical protein
LSLKANDQVHDRKPLHGGTVSGILAARLTSLQVAKMFWSKGDVRGVADALSKAGDPSVIVDVVRSVLDAPQVAGGGGGETLTLELAAALLPLTAPLLQSPHGRYADVVGLYTLNAVGPQLARTRFQPLNLSSEKLVSKFAFKCNLYCYNVALSFSRKVMGSFMPLLQQAPEALAAVERGGIGVDLVGEERAARAGAARGALLGLKPGLAGLAAAGGELAPRARELAGMLERL